MAVINSVQAIPLTSIDSATFAGTYQVINTNGLAQACFLLRIVNNSNIGVTVSYDGITDNEFVRAGESFQLPAQSNSQPNNYMANFAKLTKIYVKAAAGIGLVYLSGYYLPSVN